MYRRSVLAAAAGLVTVRAARAQGTWPDRPIRVVVPYPPGGATDVWARLVTASMAERLGQPFVVESRAGAGGMIGAEYVAKSPPDGNTLVFALSSLVQSPVVFRRSPYDAEADFAPIGQLGGTPLVFAVRPELGTATLAEFIAKARAAEAAGTPFSYGSYSPGSTGHVFSQYFSDLEKLGMTHVGYRGEAPELIDLLSGRIHCALVSITSCKQYFREGKLRGLASMGPRRVPTVPDVPTFIELGYPRDFDWTGFVGLLAPARTPQPVIAKLAEAFREAVERPEVRRVLLEQDFLIDWQPPERFRESIREAKARWVDLVNRTGITVE
ncbi:tripartite tricarboxylate transporter substrate binding protein [Roseomonas sp. NAR14]|uniref:Tripartite tricarboxylate transporter substrate binding protein n=1 Tax=Roseomonas acroporae TaxID=2937791 RepID=A0A9X1Y767_9PROT|nr:tripartite tricarboxylate transporter substrate binding protein [Roseomonas acroporae]MCK8784761.1 tripartite tricarboxylate transporter substrate binding protein [Roseomonas acroporae]